MSRQRVRPHILSPIAWGILTLAVVGSLMLTATLRVLSLQLH